MKDENYWKELALSRRWENKALKARIVEIIDGREKWKAKAMTAQEENAILKKSMEVIKKTASNRPFVKEEKPKLSHYSLTIITLFLKSKLLTSCRFRSVSRVLSIVILTLSIDLKEVRTPSRSTGMLWVKKLGYYCLTAEKEKAKDWLLILDESIGIGKETLLLILAIRRSQIDFTRPLTTQDMTPLVVKSRESWTGEAIFDELEYCKQQLGDILYATTDGSSTLKWVICDFAYAAANMPILCRPINVPNHGS